MTPEERKELARIKVQRGRYGPEQQQGTPTHKEEKKTSVWRLKLFGRIIEIRVSNLRK